MSLGFDDLLTMRFYGMITNAVVNREINLTNNITHIILYREN